MLRHLHNLFIPHAGNDHRPHALRPRALKWYVALLVGVKVVATILLFSAYPDFAKMGNDLREEIVRMVNASRATTNLPALITDPALDRAAALKAADMLQRQYFEHASPEGKMPWEWINTRTYRFQAMGENLAMDFATGESAHLALMRSNTHRKNILDARYQHVGIGVATGLFQGRETNILVEFFAQPAHVRTPVAKASSTKPSHVKPSIPLAQTSPPNAVEVLPMQFEVEESSSQEFPLPAPIRETPVSFTLPAAADAQAESILSDPRSPLPGGESVLAPVAASAPPLAPWSPSLLNGAVHAQASELTLLYRISVWTQRIFYAALVYLVFTLLINVFVKIRFQSAPLIAHTLLVILLVGGLSVLEVHTLEQLTSAVRIL